MDKSVIKRLAHQCGIDPQLNCGGLVRFAEAIASYEREECAKVCDSEEEKDFGGDCIAMACSNLIRMRSFATGQMK